jgi:hypothetical protein
MPGELSYAPNRFKTIRFVVDMDVFVEMRFLFEVCVIIPADLGASDPNWHRRGQGQIGMLSHTCGSRQHSKHSAEHPPLCITLRYVTSAGNLLCQSIHMFLYVLYAFWYVLYAFWYVFMRSGTFKMRSGTF